MLTKLLPFFILSVIGNSYAACPATLTKLCFCEDHSSGFHVTCEKIGADLNTFLSAVEKIRIDRLTVIDASWRSLKRVPLITVRSLRFVRCGIEEVEANAFSPLSDTLEELLLTNNSLTNFPLIGALPRLHRLNLNFNRLTAVPMNAFKGFSALKRLRLKGNKIKELPSGVFNSVKKTLELLDLSRNRFIYVPVKALSTVGNLKYLDLSENQIIRELRLNDNRLAKIEVGAFGNVPQLQYLYLQKNLLTYLHSISFADELRKLEVLDLSENALTQVPKLQYHQSIRQIKLDRNKISILKAAAFSSNLKLQLISLQDNAITSVDSGAFKALDQLRILLLENNIVRKLDEEMLGGIPRLQQLNMRNNSLNELSNSTFKSVPDLKIIDLAYNGLHRIPKDLLLPLRSVVWLDLSYNVLSYFEEGTFVSRIPHIILVGNPLHCDAKMDWFVAYLIKNQVRTHLPLHREVTCASPAKYTAVRLQDLITKKAEDTLNSMGRSFGTPRRENQQDLLSGIIPSSLRRLIPGLTPPPPPNPVADVPIIGGIAEAVPALRNIPGLSFIPKPQGINAEEAKKLNSAIEQFSTPLLRITSGDSLLIAEDLNQMVRAVPKFAIAPKIDIMQLPTEMVVRAYRGENIQGISNEVARNSLKDHIMKVYEAAAALSEDKTQPHQSNRLSVLNSVPEEIISDVIKGARLPYLDEKQMKVVKEYFEARAPSATETSVSDNIDFNGLELSPEIFKMLQILPPKYDPNKIPKKFIRSLLEGEVPDFELLPRDLKNYFFANFEEVLSRLAKNMRHENIIQKLPMFHRPEVTTFTPYTSNTTGGTGKRGEQIATDFVRVQRYIFGFICLVSILSFALLVVLCYRRRNEIKNLDEDEHAKATENSFSVSTSEVVPSRSSISLLSEADRFYSSPVKKFPKIS